MKELVKNIKQMDIYDLLKLIFFRTRSIYLKFNFASNNQKVYRGKDVQIIGYNKLSIKPYSSLGDSAWINIVNGGFKDNIKTVSVGEYSHIGRHNFISVCNGLTIGAYFFSSGYCSIISATHNADPFHPYIAGSVVALGEEITIGSNVFMGSNSKIIGGIKIGFGSIIGAGAVVTRDVPPLSKVVGAPATVVARYCVKSERWIPGNLIEEPLMSESDYLKLIKLKKIKVHIPYHAASTRNGWV
tara:strand:- start:403 stop:1131 length:729 start_codon:yes stop_codon:yes gene_type:complete